jgi:hypothetical protein
MFAQEQRFIAMVQAIPSFLFPLHRPKSAATPIFIICPTEATLTEKPLPCTNITKDNQICISYTRIRNCPIEKKIKIQVNKRYLVVHANVVVEQCEHCADSRAGVVGVRVPEQEHRHIGVIQRAHLLDVVTSTL